MRSIEDLFHALLQDMYFAERHLVKAFDDAARQSADTTLSHAFTMQRLETLLRIGRLEEIFASIGRRARPRHCEAILGILHELNDVIVRTASGGVRDAGIVAAAQAAAHYSYARYATLAGWAERLDEQQAVRLLRKSLDEVKAADALLGRIAVSVTPAARAA